MFIPKLHFCVCSFDGGVIALINLPNLHEIGIFTTYTVSELKIFRAINMQKSCLIFLIECTPGVVSLFLAFSLSNLNTEKLSGEYFLLRKIFRSKHVRCTNSLELCSKKHQNK